MKRVDPKQFENRNALWLYPLKGFEPDLHPTGLPLWVEDFVSEKILREANSFCVIPVATYRRIRDAIQDRNTRLEIQQLSWAENWLWDDKMRLWG